MDEIENQKPIFEALFKNLSQIFIYSESGNFEEYVVCSEVIEFLQKDLVNNEVS
jgi:hypothetical protein